MSDNPFIGQMDRVIVVKSVTKTQNTTGEEEETLVTLAQPWAYMQDVSGAEDVEGKVRHIISRSYTIRYNATIAASGNEMKIVDGTETFDVYHVKQLGRKKHLQLLVTNYE